jgi:hypothetical protein
VRKEHVQNNRRSNLQLIILRLNAFNDTFPLNVTNTKKSIKKYAAFLALHKIKFIFPAWPYSYKIDNTKSYFIISNSKYVHMKVQ